MRCSGGRLWRGRSSTTAKPSVTASVSGSGQAVVYALPGWGAAGQRDGMRRLARTSVRLSAPDHRPAGIPRGRSQCLLYGGVPCAPLLEVEGFFGVVVGLEQPRFLLSL